MSIDTFPANFRNPDYGLEGTPSFLVDKVTLGDRHERRIKKGINNKFMTWGLVWNNLSYREMDEIRDFLYGLEGVYSFHWTHPTEGQVYKCICEEFSIAHDAFERYNVSVTFKEDV